MSSPEKMPLLNATVLVYYRDALLSDPLFKDVSNRDFTLALNSPVL